MVNLAPVPDEPSDEPVLMCPDIMSTGFSGAERASVKVGDTVAIFAQGPIGLLGQSSATRRRLSPSTHCRSAWRCPELWARITLSIYVRRTQWPKLSA
jgi:hypothetical protein